MINLLPKLENNASPLERMRHLIFALTTVIIVIFITGVGSVLGMGYFQTLKTQELSKQIAYLTSEINKLSNRETLIRQIDLRQKTIDKYLTERPKTASQLNSINTAGSEIVIDTWDFESGRVGVISSSSAILQNYMQKLKQKFVNLRLENASQKGGVWISTLILK